VACLGATEADWKLLAVKALRANCLDVAKIAFGRLKDTKYLTLIEEIERGDPLSTSKGEISTAPTPTAVIGKRDGSRARGDVSKDGNTGATAETFAAISKSSQVLDPVWQAELLAYEGTIVEM
jgi:hypothetical protein